MSHDCGSQCSSHVKFRRQCFREVSPHPEALISFLFSFLLGDGGVEIDVPFRVE